MTYLGPKLYAMLAETRGEELISGKFEEVLASFQILMPAPKEAPSNSKLIARTGIRKSSNGRVKLLLDKWRVNAARQIETAEMNESVKDNWRYLLWL